MNKQEQQRYDAALISMPTCLTSSAYENNPYYHDYQTLIMFGNNEVAAFRKGQTANRDAFITNKADCELVEKWLRGLEAKYPVR